MQGTTPPPFTPLYRSPCSCTSLVSTTLYISLCGLCSSPVGSPVVSCAGCLLPAGCLCSIPFARLLHRQPVRPLCWSLCVSCEKDTQKRPQNDFKKAMYILPFANYKSRSKGVLCDIRPILLLLLYKDY